MRISYFQLYYYKFTIDYVHRKTSSDVVNENSSIGKEKNTTKKLTNGVGDLTSNISKLDISPSESPTRYPTKEGECSIQLCLNQFTALELMSGNNKVGCTSCTERENKVILGNFTFLIILFSECLLDVCRFYHLIVIFIIMTLYITFYCRGRKME